MPVRPSLLFSEHGASAPKITVLLYLAWKGYLDCTWKRTTAAIVFWPASLYLVNILWGDSTPTLLVSVLLFIGPLIAFLILTGWGAKDSERPVSSSQSSTGISTHNASISMDNPEVAALINEVVPVIDDMIKARQFAYLFTDDWHDYDPWIGRYIGDLTLTKNKTVKIQILIQAYNFQDLRNHHFRPGWGADFIRSREARINAFLEKYGHCYTPHMLSGDCGYEYTSHNCITISRKHFSQEIVNQLEHLLKTEWQKRTAEDKEPSFLYI